jgi:anaerobic magnesium-protoporphyrin IX monomethyl ester cyclase
MPEMAWDLLPMKEYRAHNWHCFGRLQRQPYASFYTTFGCPYHCSFCCIQAPFKSGEKEAGWKDSVNSYRFWSPAAVVAQIEKLVTNYGVRNIKIADEMFVLNPRHVHGICDAIIERGYDLNIWAYARVDTVKDDMLDKLKRAGFNWLAFGIEAASERVRDDVDKGFGQEEIFHTIEKVRAAGINVIGNYIFGLPEDDLQSMQATLDLALELNCEFANFYSAMAYPGSQLYNLAVKEGWPLPEKWSGYSQHSYDALPLPTKYLSGPEVLRFRDHAFNAYFNNARYLGMIADKFGVETAQHLKRMTGHKLERKFLGTPTGVH